VLRAVATLGVVAWHLASELNSAGNTVTEFFVGQAGVDLFFVISGFVMVYASTPLFGTPGGSILFLTRRLIRILPLYWAIRPAARDCKRNAGGRSVGPVKCPCSRDV
jgi:exopolysaccharide production protein ExoZ